MESLDGAPQQLGGDDAGSESVDAVCPSRVKSCDPSDALGQLFVKTGMQGYGSAQVIPHQEHSVLAGEGKLFEHPFEEAQGLPLLMEFLAAGAELLPFGAAEPRQI